MDLVLYSFLCHDALLFKAMHSGSSVFHSVLCGDATWKGTQLMSSLVYWLAYSGDWVSVTMLKNKDGSVQELRSIFGHLKSLA